MSEGGTREGEREGGREAKLLENRRNCIRDITIIKGEGGRWSDGRGAVVQHLSVVKLVRSSIKRQMSLSHSD